LVEGSGVIVEAVACDGACTADTHGIGNGNIVIMVTVMAMVANVVMVPVIRNGSHG